jgi:hypothetical protein
MLEVRMGKIFLDFHYTCRWLDKVGPTMFDYAYFANSTLALKAHTNVVHESN